MPVKTRKAKFKVGQEVVTNVSYSAPYHFRIGFVNRSESEDGTPFFWYTENKTDTPPYWTEAALRPLTKREKGQ